MSSRRSALLEVYSYDEPLPLPDSSPATSWPRNDGEPLGFIAQVNLAEVAPFDTEGVLPNEGLLSFYDAVTQSAWGFDPADSGSAGALHTCTRHRGISFVPGRPGRGRRFQGAAAATAVPASFAPWESFDIEALGMTRDEGFSYAELFNDQDAIVHRLLGHPDPVQGDMQVECQLVTNGLSTGDNDPRASELRDGAADWRLLLQIDSEDEAEMMWGDVGRLYYWIKHSDLVARNWELSWLILQCC